MKMKREDYRVGTGQRKSGPMWGKLGPGHFLSRSLLVFDQVITWLRLGHYLRARRRCQHARAIRRHSLLLLQTENMFWVHGGENGPLSLGGHHLHRGGQEHASRYLAEPVGGKMGLDPNAAGRSSLRFNEGIICCQQAKVPTCKAT